MKRVISIINNYLTGMKIRIAITVLFAAIIVPLSASAQVVDTTPPIITAPANQSFATTTFPAFPALTKATATDNIDPNPAITYSPLSFATGTTAVIWTATDTSGNTSTTTSNVTVTAESAQIAIRDGNVLVGPFTVLLPSPNATPVSITPTGSTTSYAIPARSVLSQLTSLDAATSSFAITDLQYFSSFNSFLVNCISVPSASDTPHCFNWTYAVNGSFPFFGMDAYILQNGDTSYIFFGSQLQVSTDKSAVSTGESFIVTAQKYEPSSGTYVPSSGEVAGAVQFDSNFNATEFATSTTDSNGRATLSVGSAGAYQVGTRGSGYFPNTSITVSAPVQNPASANSGGGGGGSGSYPVTHTSFNVSSALLYLVSKQHLDGSFDSSLLSDWAALAFSAANPGTALAGQAKTNLRNYLLISAPALSSATDYERHAMALQALGINPYSDTAINYIDKILGYFDGKQIGDTGLVNDDIFAIFPLLHAGYTTNDDVIQKTVAFIVTKQFSNGSWDGNVDMTAAAVQALSQVGSLPNVPSAIDRAKSYLHSKQEWNGGFGNSFSTSWALQAIASLGESPTSWASLSGYYPTDYLTGLQQTDGGVEPTSSDTQTRIWATAYAIPAASGKTWGSLLSAFAKPGNLAASGGASSIVNATSASASSTIQITATSTALIATSTPSVISATSSTALIVQNSTTATSSPQLPTESKKKIPEKQAKGAVVSNNTNTPSTTGQLAAVAAVEQTDSSGTLFFIYLWNAITSFLRELF